MIRWLRVVISPGWVIAMLVIGWLPYAILGTAWWSLLGQPPDPQVRLITVGVLGMCVLVYGCYRVVRFHPAYPLRADYAAWLARTPWTPDKPLPDGPVLLAVQDVVVLGLMIGPAWLAFGSEAWPIVPMFAIAYLVTLGEHLHRTGERVAAYLVWFAVGGMMFLVHVPPAALGLAVAAYAVAAVGFRWSLWRFPWQPEADAQTRQRVTEALTLGWPFDRLMPLFAPPRLRPWEGVVRGVLIAWALFAIGFQLDRVEPDHRGDRPSIIIQMVLFIVFGAALMRMAGYMIGHLPPISILGRLATGRLIVPPYDVVFVAPLLAVLVACAGPLVCLFAEVPLYIGAALGSGLAFAILLTVGPERAKWQLTAPARLVPIGKPPVRKPTPVQAALARG